MTISTLAGLAAANRQKLLIKNNSAIAPLGSNLVLNSALIQDYPAPMGAIGNTTTGVVPTSASAGFPPIAAFSGAGVLVSVEQNHPFWSTSTLQGRPLVYDRLFHMGAVAGNVAATTTLSTQPSYSARVPGGTDYTGLQIGVEIAATGVGTSTLVEVTYTSQSGGTGHTTGAFAISGFSSGVPGYVKLLPLASGDCGVQTIESVIISSGGGTMFSGTLNFFIARPLAMLLTNISANTPPRIFPLETVGCPQIWSDSAISLLFINNSSTVAPYEYVIEIAGG